MLQKQTKILVFFIYIIFLPIILFYLFYIIPHKGIDFSDMGSIYYSALTPLNHNLSFSLFSILKPDLLDTLLMSLGMRNIFSLQLSFALIIGMTAFIFVYSIKKNLAWIASPIIIAISLYTGWLSFANYQNTPILFLLLSFSCFYLGLDRESKISHLLLLFLSAIFITLSICTNMALIPGGFFIVITLGWLYRKQLGLFLPVFFIISVSGFFIYYSLTIGINNLFHTPHSLLPNSSTPNLYLTRIIKLTSYFVLMLSLMFLSVLVANFFGKKIKKHSTEITFLFACLMIFAALLLFKKNFPIMTDATSTNLLTIIAIYLATLSFGAIFFLTDWQQTEEQRLITVFVFGLIYLIGQAITTDNPLLMPLNYYGILFASIIVILFFIRSQQALSLNKTLCIFISILLLVVAVSCYAQLNFAYGNGRTIENISTLRQPILSPMKVTPAKKQLLDQIFAIYQQQHCANKSFAAFNDLSILYYLFNRSALFHLEWIQSFISVNQVPPVDHEQVNQELMAWLHSQQHWCVFYSPGFTNQLPRTQVLSLLKQLSSKSFQFTYTAKSKGDVWVESAPSEYVVFIR